MCGIAGIYITRGAPVDVAVLRRMTAAQRHRGPDDQGARLFSLRHRKDADCVLAGSPANAEGFEGGVGFNRLSILDLSTDGRQPMRSADGEVFIAYNGEVYNAFHHRAELRAAGAEFVSRTDTEVLLQLYERYGIEGMLERLNGMFALCIVDLREGAMYLARDRLGIKPMYWWEGDGTFLFSSEIKSFLYHPAFEPRLDGSALDEYFAFRYCAGERTLLAGVHELEPGHWMRLTPRGRTIDGYWELPGPPAGPPPSFDEAVAGLDARLKRAVEVRLLSDVKLGCQLSGGVDSSLVSVLASESAGADLDAISIVFDDPRLSEGPWMDHVAERGGVRVHKFTLTPDYFLEQLPRATWSMDQPLNQPNSIGIYLLAEMARPFMTVLLSGEGGGRAAGRVPALLSRRTALARRATAPAPVRPAEDTQPLRLSARPVGQVGCRRLVHRGLGLPRPRHAHGVAARRTPTRGAGAQAAHLRRGLWRLPERLHELRAAHVPRGSAHASGPDDHGPLD